MDTPIVVFPDRFATALGTDGRKDVPSFPVVDLSLALTASYRTDAHFTLGVVQGADDQPRLRKTGDTPSLSFLPAGTTVAFGAVVVDGDAPDDPPGGMDGWWEEQLTLLTASPLWPCAWYRTRGGYRLLWRLEEPVVDPAAFEALLPRVYATLTTAGLTPDRLVDWTRQFRLPFVRRDGVDERRESYLLDNIPFLPIDSVQASTAPSYPSVGAAVAAAPNLSPMDDEEWRAGEGVRNKNLFAFARRVVTSMPDLSREMVFVLTEAVNQEKCKPPKPQSEVLQIVTNALKYTPAVAPTTASAPASPPPIQRRQVLLAKSEIVRVLEDCKNVLARIPGIYKQSGAWVRLGRDMENCLIIEQLPKPSLRVLVEQYIQFMVEKSDPKTGETFFLPSDMPRDVVDALECIPDIPVPELQEVLTTPTLAPDASLVAEAGYHPSLLSYLEPAFTVSPGASRQDAEAALAELKDLLTDFPFEQDQHRSVALAAIITPVVRSAIRGPVPLVVFDGTTPNSGKSLLADIVSILATGRDAPKQALTDEVEFEKRVTALLQSGVRAVLLDNIDKPLGGATLDALLTADTWIGRVLGSTSMVKLRARAQWMATGNNVTIQGDLSRRAIRCFLSPDMERPEERADYKYPRPREHVQANRARYVEAALTVVRAWMLSGDKVALPSMGSYESWSDIVRSALVWLGEDDPVATQAELRADSSLGVWGTVLEACENIWGGGKPFHAKDVYDALYKGVRKGGTKEAYSALEGALDELLPGNQPSVRGIAILFRRWAGRIVGGRRLSKAPRTRAGLAYMVATGAVAEAPGVGQAASA